MFLTLKKHLHRCFQRPQYVFCTQEYTKREQDHDKCHLCKEDIKHIAQEVVKYKDEEKKQRLSLWSSEVSLWISAFLTLTLPSQLSTDKLPVLFSISTYCI